MDREELVKLAAGLYSLRFPEADVSLEVAGPHIARVKIDEQTVNPTAIICGAQASTNPVEYLVERVDSLDLNEVQRHLELPWKMVREKVLPRIGRIEKDYIIEPEAELVRRMAPDIVIYYVLDLPDVTVAITGERARRWGVDLKQVDEVARANLERKSPTAALRDLCACHQGPILLVDDDGYASERILLPSFYLECAKELGDEFLVGLPARNLLLVVPMCYEPRRKELEEMLRYLNEERPYPIVPHLLRMSADGLAQF